MNATFCLRAILLSLLAWLAFSIDARAQDVSLCFSNNDTAYCASRQLAYQEGLRLANSRHAPEAGYTGSSPWCTRGGNANGPQPYYGCGYRTIFGTQTVYRYWVAECPAGSQWDDATKKCSQPCLTSDPPLSGGWVLGDWTSDTSLPTAVCSDGCKYTQPLGSREVSCVDGQCWTRVNGFTAAGQKCAAGDAALAGDPPPDSDNDGISDGNDGDPNNPGQSTPTGDNPPDGKTNDSGDGSGNNNQSVGGGNCASPPSSSGDAILAQIAYQAWSTRCAIESAKDGSGNLRTTQGTGTGTGGTGSTTGMGECTQGGVNQAICVSKQYLQKLSDFVTALGDESATLDTSPGQLEDAQSIWADAPEPDDLNSAGFGLGSSCPAPPMYMGQSLDPNGYLCMFAGIIGALVLVAAYAQAAYIIGRA